LAVIIVLVQLPDPDGQTNLLAERVVVVTTVTVVVFEVPVVVVPVVPGPFASA
jgi:hypothetical protein